jgi:hypothetical protein
MNCPASFLLCCDGLRTASLGGSAADASVDGVRERVVRASEDKAAALGCSSSSSSSSSSSRGRATIHGDFLLEGREVFWHGR